MRPDPAFDVSLVALSGDPDRFAEWVDGAEFPVKVVDGPPTIESVALTTTRGEVELRPGA